METKKEIDSLKEFFESRKKIFNITGIAEDAGIGYSTLNKILRHEFQPSVELINKLKRTACKYGYRGPIDI